MRLREFILLEYKRDKTAQNFGQKLLAKLVNDRSFHNIMARELNIGFRELYYQEPSSREWVPNDQSSVTKLVNASLELIESADPSANKQYVQWLVLRYLDGTFRLFEDVLGGHTTEILQQFHELKQRQQLPPELADINRVKGRNNLGLFASDIRDLYDDFKTARGEKEEEAQLAKGDANEVFSDGHVRVIVPEDRQAACYYGQGTQWCTAATKGANYFGEYHKDGKMYILLPTKPHYDGEKYQLHFASGQYMDETDSQVELSELLDGRFHDSGLLEFFRKKEPTVNNLIQFAPEGLLMDVIQKISEYTIHELVAEMVSSWEMDDDYYYTWLTDEGYVTDDEVSDDAPSYADYNDEVGDFEATIKNLVDLNRDELVDISEDYSAEMESPTVIKDIAEAIAWNMKEQSGKYEFDAAIEDVAEDIEKHLVVKVQWGGDGQPSGFHLIYGWMTMEDGRHKWNERVYAEKKYK
jgi:hypothetical protein